MINRKINTSLQYTFYSMEFFLQLDILFVYNSSWLISAPNINQSTVGIEWNCMDPCLIALSFLKYIPLYLVKISWSNCCWPDMLTSLTSCPFINLNIIWRPFDVYSMFIGCWGSFKNKNISLTYLVKRSWSNCCWLDILTSSTSRRSLYSSSSAVSSRTLRSSPSTTSGL